MTIKDVAEHSGVSVSTVSRVLNNHPDVSDAVRERVMDAVRQLHYVPNNSARDLVKSRTDAIGVVVRGAENPFFTPVIRSIENAAENAGYEMVLHQIKAGADELDAAALLTRSKRLNGLILLGGCYDYTPEQTAALGVPFVCCTFTNGFGCLDAAAYSSVSIDDRAEAYRAVQLLLSRGHRRIAVLLDSTRDHSISELRYQGYCEALRDAGLPLDGALVAETVEFEMSAAYERMRRLLEEGVPFSAVFAIADSMAIAAMKALHDAGRRVPEDCSVIAIDGIEMSRYTVPTLTTLIQPAETIGERAVGILTDVLEQRSECRHLRVETTLRPGGTLGPCVRGV